jgi:Sec-independent protein translocase protein TatA
LDTFEGGFGVPGLLPGTAQDLGEIARECGEMIQDLRKMTRKPSEIIQEPGERVRQLSEMTQESRVLTKRNKR